MKKENYIDVSGVIINHCCIVILAAGGASRMGKPKLLLSYNGTSLLEHAIVAAKGSGISRMVVVAGSGNEAVESISTQNNISTVYNERWKEGISSSVQKGLIHAISLWPETDAVIFMVADQPFVTGNLLSEILREQRSSGFAAVGSGYGGTVGTPALFHRSLFEEIHGLSGDNGARKILLNHKDQIGIVPFMAGETDIDTPAEYEALVNAGMKKSS